jgi:hypothetical protein
MHRATNPCVFGECDHPEHRRPEPPNLGVARKIMRARLFAAVDSVRSATVPLPRKQDSLPGIERLIR